MIAHLHFLPLTTLLLAVYARLWVISADISAHIHHGEEQALGDTKKTQNARLSANEAIGMAMTEKGWQKVARSELRDRTRGVQEHQTDQQLNAVRLVNQIPALDDSGLNVDMDFGTVIARARGSQDPTPTTSAIASPVISRADSIDSFTKVQKTTGADRPLLAASPPPMSFSQPCSGRSTPITDYPHRALAPVAAKRHNPSRDDPVPLPSSLESAAKTFTSTHARPAKVKRPKMDALFDSLATDDKVRVNPPTRHKTSAIASPPPSSSSLIRPSMTTETLKAKPQDKQKPSSKKKRKGDSLDDIFGF